MPGSEATRNATPVPAAGLVAGRDALMEQLLADGFSHVFGNPGTTEIGFLDSLRGYPRLDFVVALHEAVAVGLAEGYARATRRPSLAQLHVAPGLGNGLGMLVNQTEGQTPMVVYVGNASTETIAREPLLSGDIVAIARPVCKWAVQVPHAADLPRLTRRALKVAAEPPQGPVVLAIPEDVLEEQAAVEVVATTYSRTEAPPAAADLAELARILGAAERPLIVVGDGYAGGGAAELAELAETLGAIVLGGGWSSETVLPAGCRLWAGSFYNAPVAAAREAYLEADVRLYLGAPVEPPAFDKRGPGEDGAAILQLDLDRSALAKNQPAALAIAVSPRAAVPPLLAALAARAADDPEWGRRRRVAADSQAAALAAGEGELRAAAAAEHDQVPIPASRLASALESALPAEAVVFDESLSARRWTSRRLGREPGSYFRARGGGIGSGMSATVGMQLALPDRPVVGLVGDGSSMYSISAIWTAAHHRVPATWVIVNNRSYRSLKANGLAYLGSTEAAANLPGVDLGDPPIAFDALARSLGVASTRVEHPDDLVEALARAVASPEPNLVEVIIDGSFP